MVHIAFVMHSKQLVGSWVHLAVVTAQSAAVLVIEMDAGVFVVMPFQIGVYLLDGAKSSGQVAGKLAFQF